MGCSTSNHAVYISKPRDLLGNGREETKAERPDAAVRRNPEQPTHVQGMEGRSRSKQSQTTTRSFPSLGSASIGRDHGTMVTDHPLRSTVRLDHPVSAHSKLQKGTFNPPASKPCPERSHGPASVALPFQHQIRTRCMSHPDICQIPVCRSDFEG